MCFPCGVDLGMAAAEVSSSSTRKRTHLSLEKKVEIISKSKDNPGIGVRALADIFSCSKTQIAAILKQKESILASYESNASISKKSRAPKFLDINVALYQWYSLTCSKNIYPDGPQLLEKARKIAECLGKRDFVGTNGWLEKWKQRYHVRRVAICGESGDVSGVMVSSWKERLPEIVRGYEKKNIYNLDETGCFWRALPERGFVEKGKRCNGGKKSKLRLTIAFLVNASGEKEQPIVIWNSANPKSVTRQILSPTKSMDDWRDSGFFFVFI